MTIPVNGRTTTRRTGLTLPAGLSLAQWRHLGQQMHVVTDSSAWWLGDWLVYGQHQFPGRYRSALERTGLDYQTLRNYAWVARKYEPSRRRAGLSFQHHAEVAALPPEKQDEWLALAEQGGWTRNELRRRIRTSRTEQPEVTGAQETGAQEAGLVRVNVAAVRREHWQKAAESAGLDLRDWMIKMLDEAAAQMTGLIPDGESENTAS